MWKLNELPVLAAGRSSVFVPCNIGGYVKYLAVWKCAFFHKMPLSIWDEKAVQMKYGLRDSSPEKGIQILYNALLSGSITTKLWKRTFFWLSSAWQATEHSPLTYVIIFCALGETLISQPWKTDITWNRNNTLHLKRYIPRSLNFTILLYCPKNI